MDSHPFQITDPVIIGFGLLFVVIILAMILAIVVIGHQKRALVDFELAEIVRKRSQLGIGDFICVGRIPRLIEDTLEIEPEELLKVIGFSKNNVLLYTSRQCKRDEWTKNGPVIRLSEYGVDSGKDDKICDTNQLLLRLS